MRRLILLLLFGTLIRCSSNNSNGAEKVDALNKTVQSDAIDSNSEVGSSEQPSEDLLKERTPKKEINYSEASNRLNENSIYGLAIPFGHLEMIDQIKKSFSGYEVTKELGQQDGPDFPLYSVKKSNNNVLFFSMDWEDTLKLREIIIKGPEIVDEYGLRVGDGFKDIKSKRKKPIKTSTDFHQRTFAYTDSSNIMYEISGNVFMSDTVDLENLKFTEEEMEDWTIDLIIWRKQ